MNLLVVTLIALSLSMDAFSLAISIGTIGFDKSKCLLLSLSVGIFHFFMPMVGSFLGTNFINHFNINSEFLSGIIFAYISLQMIKEFFLESREEFKMNFLGIILFAFGVSLDSFGVGFTMNEKIVELTNAFLIFSLFSFIFTYVGLNLGKVLKRIIGNYSILFGGIIMLLLSIINFVNFCSLN